MTQYTDLLDRLPEDDRKIILAANERTRERAIKDTANKIHLVAEIRAGPMRVEAAEYEGKITFTMCFDNDVMAHMGENAAKMFTDFVRDTLERRG